MAHEQVGIERSHIRAHDCAANLLVGDAFKGEVIVDEDVLGQDRGIIEKIKWIRKWAPDDWLLHKYDYLDRLGKQYNRDQTYYSVLKDFVNGDNEYDQLRGLGMCTLDHDEISEVHELIQEGSGDKGE